MARFKKSRRQTHVARRHLASTAKERRENQQRFEAGVALMCVGLAFCAGAGAPGGGLGLRRIAPLALDSDPESSGSESEDEDDDWPGGQAFSAAGGAGAGRGDAFGKGLLVLGGVELTRWHLGRLEAEPRVAGDWSIAAGWDDVNMSDNVCRFKLADVPRLEQVLGLPPVMKTKSGFTFSAREGLMVVLHHLATGETFLRMAQSRLHRGSDSRLSEVFNHVVQEIPARHGHRVVLENNSKYMQESEKLIAQKADGAGEVAGFLDCTGLQIFKPSGPVEQQYYSGFKSECSGADGIGEGAD